MAACGCGADGPVRLLYACSGSANTGLLADGVARRLAKLGIGNMTCLAAVGAKLSGFLESARGAGTNVVIDGCPVSCGAKIFGALDIPFRHFKTTDFGVEKGKTEITGELINKVALKIAEVMADEPVAGPNVAR